MLKSTKPLQLTYQGLLSENAWRYQDYLRDMFSKFCVEMVEKLDERSSVRYERTMLEGQKLVSSRS